MMDVPKALLHLRALIISGVDARTFLQAQLSANLDSVTDENAVMAASCAVNGRVVGLGWLAAHAQHFVWYVHEAQALALRDGLRKFKLRAKCTIDVDARAVTVGATGESSARLPDGRSLSLHTSAAIDHAAQLQWRLADIAQRYPVYGGGERFLPQMLGLESLGGLSLKKGCFPGQEVIARLHYKGELKRELRRMTASAALLAGRYRLVDRAEEIDVIQVIDRQLLAIVGRAVDMSFAIELRDQRVLLSMC
jgi:tRNA-modifying protein YgfZ